MLHCLVSHYSMFGLILITFTKSSILSLFTKTGNLWTGWILQSIECFPVKCCSALPSYQE